MASWLDYIGDAWDAIGGLKGVGKAAGLAGTVMNAFGGDATPRQNATPEGFQSLYNTGNPEFTDFVKNDVLQMIMNAAKQPRVARPMRRLTSADMQGDFAPKAAYALQNYGDEQAAAQEAALAEQQVKKTENPEQSKSVFPQGNTDIVSIRRALATDPNDMSPAAQEKRRQLYTMETALQNFTDGQVNPYTGETFDKSRFLNFIQGQADYDVSNPRNSFGFRPTTPEAEKAMFDEREALYRQTFIPSKSKASLMGRFGAPLALALMTGGLGAAASALPTVVGAGGISPVAAAKGAKALTSLATAGR